MKQQKSASKSAFLLARTLTAIALCLSGVALAVVAINNSALQRSAPVVADDELAEAMKPMPLPDSEEDEAERLEQLEQFWNDRVTYPTGVFNPEWVRAAVRHDKTITEAIPEGSHARLSMRGQYMDALSTTSWTGLGPSPERMTGCTGCFDYTKTAGRVNEVVVDPTTTTNGSIVAYAAGVGGGVWKTTNCCSSTTTWNLTTNDPLIATLAIGELTMDPNDHNTLYAGTGDLRFGNLTFGSQGILKTTDAGATWKVLGSEVFVPSYPLAAGQFPQYNAVGKVRVDPNNSNNVVAGTKLGLYFSRDGGITWTGPVSPHGFSGQRNDITGLDLKNIGGVTRIIAAVGVRGFATASQVEIGNNGGNGIYSTTLPAEGVPSTPFTFLTTNASGWRFGQQVTGSPYATNAPLNASSGQAYGGVNIGNQIGRIDMAVAPSNPNVIYAQVQSIAPNNNSGCGNTSGCQLGAFYSNDAGATWTFMPGSQGGALRQCQNTGTANSATSPGDYPQNWYDQHVEVDPNDPNRVFFDTHEIWFATQNGTQWYDLSCVYTQSTAIGVHADQHALTFVPGSSSILLAGHDGGVSGATDVHLTVLNTKRPAWFNMDNGFNTIEFYAGDISGNFATSSNPHAVGGSQDNGPSSVMFNGQPTGPAEWQMGLGGDGFSGQIETVNGYATGTIVYTTPAVAGETFVIGSQTFTFVATRTGAGQVAISTVANTQGNNIVAAINADIPATATAFRPAGTTIYVAASYPGPTGNDVTFTENASTLTMNGSGKLGGTIAGGAPNMSRFWEGNNSGGLARCFLNCTQGGAIWQSRRSWNADQQSFVLPVNLFHGGIPGGDQCLENAPSNGCGHMIAGTTRVWETVTAHTFVNDWYITNNPPGATGGPNLTKGTLGNRSYINQVKYSPKYFSVAIAGTNDGNVQIGFNLGTGVASQANWVNVTGNNAVLPNRPILGIALDPSVPARDVPVGYASVGGFDENTPSTPGHVFQVTCTSNCASFTWLNKTGNLPNIPAASIIPNPNNAKQVFVGTDWGVYFTNDITQASPVWSRFTNGMPYTMIWELQIDRGATTLSAWTRGRGAWVYPLPSADISLAAPTLHSAASRMNHAGSGNRDLPLALSGQPTVEPRRNSAGTFQVVFTFSEPVNSGTASSSSGSTSTSFSGNNMIVNVSGVNDRQTITVTANNVSGPDTDTMPSASVSMSVLQGDVTNDRTVNSGDLMQVRSHSGQATDGINFRYDVNVDGFINVGDTIVTRNKSGNTL